MLRRKNSNNLTRQIIRPENQQHEMPLGFLVGKSEIGKLLVWMLAEKDITEVIQNL
jgi:hypothetical protein